MITRFSAIKAAICSTHEVGDSPELILLAIQIQGPHVSNASSRRSQKVFNLRLPDPSRA
jgi:hypothetical protein